ncbi:TonB-dependent receptor plug domain-containing protein [Erythrobacter sp. MTPC3]|uniref:TonB-dependent receptor plug domain-containing protein n=1 Tax=Erythrobacter sp. MTPC3 TaxID=3056564 RepID=UPI0036F210B6
MKKYVRLGGAASAALIWCAPVMAQDQGTEYLYPEPAERPEVLVTASRIDTEVETGDYTGSASVITPEQIERRQVRDIGDVLRDVPGIAVSSVAGQTQIRLRGSEANHVLVLVDGIEVSDPFGGEFDIGTLQAEIGSRVEVLRGPQSALYGNDAIGGVVAYQSARGRDAEGFAARLEGGTAGTINGSARLGLAGERWDTALSATVVSTDGQPNSRPIGGGERDIGRDSYTLSGKAAADVTDTFELRAAGRFIRTEGDFNDSDFDTTAPTFGFIIDSPGTRFENEAVYALAGARLEMLDGAWSQDVSVQIADITRDSFNAFGRSSGSEGDRLKASYVNAFSIASSHFVTFAADWERERFRNNDPFGFASATRQKIENVGLVGEYRYAGERLDLSAALRRDINDRFANETTFRIGAGFDVTESTRVRASAGSGIKNPGFFELFGFFDGRFIGNEDLAPEKSTGWEVGIDHSFELGDTKIGVTYFDNNLENEIFTTFPAPDFTATPANADTKSQRSGVEIALFSRIAPQWTIDAAYSYLDAEENGVSEVRRPRHIASAALGWTHPGDAASATLVVRHNGAAQDLAFTDPSFVPVRVTLDDYTLVNLNANVRLTDGIEAFARVENLFDDTYEQVFSFVSPGRSAAAGISVRF